MPNDFTCQRKSSSGEKVTNLQLSAQRVYQRERERERGEICHRESQLYQRGEVYQRGGFTRKGLITEGAGSYWILSYQGGFYYRGVIREAGYRRMY